MSDNNKDLTTYEFTTARSRRSRAWIFAVMVLFAVVVVFIFFRSGEVKSLISTVTSVLSPVIYGISFAYILNPIVVFIERIYSMLAVNVFHAKTTKYKKHANIIGIVLSVALLLWIIWMLLSTLLPQILETIITLINLIPAEFEQIEKWYAQFITPDKEWTLILDTALKSLLDTAEQWFTGDVSQTVTSALNYITSGITTVVRVVIDVVIGICVAIYFLKDKTRIFAHLHKIVYSLFKEKKSAMLVDIGVRAKEIFNGYVYGTLLGSVVVFCTTLIFMMITNMPYALLISTIVCITNIIPFFGPFIGAIPSVFILLLHDPMTALVFAIFTLVIQQVEGHLLTPLIISGTTGVSPFWVTVALLIGGGLFGFSGLLFSVPTFSVIYYLIKITVENKLTAKKLPVDSTYYESNADYDYKRISLGFKEIVNNINSRVVKKRRKK